MRLPRFLMPRTVASAHCDLPCGVYDPAQARIEAESVKAIAEKYQANTVAMAAVGLSSDLREMRALMTRERPAAGAWDLKLSPGGLVDIEFAAQFLQLAGASGAKGSVDPAVAEQLLGKIEEISKIFWETKQA